MDVIYHCKDEHRWFVIVFDYTHKKYITSIPLALCCQANFEFCISSSLSAVNEYVFMVQARGIQIRENMKNIGAQVLEQVVRGAYSLNGTGNKTVPSNHRQSEVC